MAGAVEIGEDLNLLTPAEDLPVLYIHIVTQRHPFFEYYFLQTEVKESTSGCAFRVTRGIGERSSHHRNLEILASSLSRSPSPAPYLLRSFVALLDSETGTSLQLDY